MKKLFLLLAVVGMLATACETGGVDDGTTPPNEQPSDNPDIGDEDLTFSNNTDVTPTIPHEGGTATISFTAALDWSVSVYAEWLSVSKNEGEAGNGSFVITAEANDGDKERKGYLSICLSNDKSYEIVVTQSANAGGSDIEFINNTNTAPHMEYGGGTVNIQFIAKSDWTVTCYADWLSTNKSSGSKGENSFFITAASNPKDQERSGVVAIKSASNKSYEITVTQDPNAGILQLTVAANEVLYTTVFDTQINLNNQNGFGGNLISHSYDAEKGYGSIRFDNYVTSIPSKAFKGCTTLESIYLPEGVTYIAPDAFEGCTNLKYIISPNSDNYTMFVYNNELMAIAPGLTDVIIPKEVKSLDNVVFQNSKVENLTLYASTSIDAYAFRNNETLKTLTIIDVEHGNGTIGNNAFEQCSQLTQVRIGEGVSGIGGSAFYQCPQLTNVSIGGGGTKLVDKTFYNCSSLTSLTLGDGVTYIGNEAFYGCNSLTSVTIPSGVTYVGYSAFQDCTSLASVIIENGVTSIGYAAFYGCTSLASISIPDSVTSIGRETFYNCSSLKSAVIGNGVTSIGYAAFSQCSQLTQVRIGEGVTGIDGAAFSGCSSLTSINIPRSVTHIQNRAFEDCQGELIIDSKTIFEKDYTSSNSNGAGCWLAGSKFTKLTIGDNITKIGEYTFYKYSSLTSVAIGNSLTEVGDNAFVGCSSLKSVYISDLSAWCKISWRDPLSVQKDLYLNGNLVTELTIPSEITMIYSYAFYGCTSLTSVTIPDSVTLIGDWAFYGCTSLTSVYCKPTTPPTGGSNMFSYYNGGYKPIGCKIYVPHGSVDAYKAASFWSDYASYIEGKEF